MGHIKRGHLRDALCVVPSGPVMVAANRICRPIHNRCVAARMESGVLGRLRDALLPKLIAGEVRVGEAEKLVEAVT